MDYENKRVNRIVEAWKVLYEKYVDWELVLVGEGPYKSTLEEYIRRYDIQRVCFKGFQVSPPIQHYKEASIFLLTSDLEGFGLVVIESMSYGVVPVVYGSYEAIYDIIDNGKSGLITPIPYNSQKTIDCISLLIENEELRKKMANMDFSRHISDDAIDYIANMCPSDVRSLEGALTRVCAYSTIFFQEEITLDLTIEALKGTITPMTNFKNDIQKIQRVVAEHYNVSVEDLKSKKRVATIAFPRQIAIYLSRQLTDESFPKIGIEFGGRDHSTVMHSCDKIEKAGSVQPVFSPV